MATFQVYKDHKSEYRWRLKAANGDIVAVASEGYSSKQNAEKSVSWVKANASSATVEDLTQPKAAASGYW